MRFEAICDVPWVYFSERRRPETGPKSELDDEVSFTIAITSEALREKPDGVAMDLLRYVFFAMNWPDVADSPENLAELMRAGYKYNGWRVPTKLKE